eukprot:g4523.t1
MTSQLQLQSQRPEDSLSCIPLPLHEAKELQEKLGQFFMGGRRQRWYWTSWKITHWVELRPANVIWHSKHGAGTWQMWKDRDAKHQVAIYLHERRGQDEKVKEEVRYILWHKAGSDPPVFEEKGPSLCRVCTGTRRPCDLGSEARGVCIYKHA